MRFILQQHCKCPVQLFHLFLFPLILLHQYMPLPLQIFLIFAICFQIFHYFTSTATLQLNVLFQIYRLVPKLEPQEICEDVPREVCNYNKLEVISYTPKTIKLSPLIHQQIALLCLLYLYVDITNEYQKYKSVEVTNVRGSNLEVISYKAKFIKLSPIYHASHIKTNFMTVNFVPQEVTNQK